MASNSDILITEEFSKLFLYKNYSISNLGRVRNDVTNEFEDLKLDKEGYLYVKLYGCQNSYKERIHRLVAKNFIKNDDKHRCVRHLDKNKLNNKVENLEWYTTTKYMSKKVCVSNQARK